MSKEFFPPNKPAPLILGAKFRENIISKIFFKYPLPTILIKELKENMHDYKFSIINFQDITILIQLIRLNNFKKMETFTYRNIPYGRFIVNPLIGKYGVKHFKISIFENVKNTLILFRFISSFRVINNILLKQEYSHVLFINGRDTVGSAAQLAAYVNKKSVISLEGGQGIFTIPKYGEWQGNMHHWKVMQGALDLTNRTYSGEFTTNHARSYFNNRYGHNSKWWKNANLAPMIDLPQRDKVVSFFTSSEEETTTAPIGFCGKSEFDNYDQVEILEKLQSITLSRDMVLVIRLHPSNFTNPKKIKFVDDYFKDLTKSWPNTILIKSSEKVSSYELGKKSLVNFVFRSTLASEFTIQNIPVYVVAQTENSKYAPKQQALTIRDMERVIDNPTNQSSMNIDGVRAYACYLEKFGQSFQYIKILNKDNSISQLEYWHNGKMLDVPRFKFKTFRK